MEPGMAGDYGAAGGAECLAIAGGTAVESVAHPAPIRLEAGHERHDKAGQRHPIIRRRRSQSPSHHGCNRRPTAPFDDRSAGRFESSSSR